jgi:hypothetical protein
MTERLSVGSAMKRRNLLTVGSLFVALVLMAIFASAYIGALHKPAPHAVPIGVTDARTGAVLQAAGGAFAARREPDLARLRHDLKDRKISAGLVGRTLYVASGASYSTSVFLSAAFSKQLPGLQVVDVAPLQVGDPRGLSLFYLAFAFVFGGYLAATVVSTLLGYGLHSHRRAALRLVALAVFSVMAGVVGAALVDVAFGAIKGHFLSVAAVGALLTFAVAAATQGLQFALGIAGTLVAMVAFIMLGNSSSGGAYQGTFIPGFWRAIGPYLPPGAGLSSLRSVVYFDGANVAGRLTVLAVYAIVGAVVTVVLGWRRGPQAAELEVATAAAL